MTLLKKLIFAPFFLISFIALVYQFGPFLKSYDFIFSLSINTLTDLITISLLITTSCLLFVIFVSIAENYKISLPVSLLSALIPLFFLDQALGLVFSVAIFVSLLLINLTLDSTLRSYLNFSANALLGPSTRNLSGLLILSFCIIYFFSANKFIAQQGFQIPDSLIDTALKFSAPATSGLQQEQSSLPQITPEQLNLLKKNPETLKQFGLNPNILDSLTNPQKTNQPEENLTNTLIKQTIKDQLQSVIKPYIGFVPAGLAVLLFLTLQFFTSLTNLLIYPLLWLIFLFLEKSGFIKFTIEQREVKKMVV